jgi:pantoate kinase
MTKNRELFATIGIIVVALLVGGGIGHSFTKTPATLERVSAAPTPVPVVKVKTAEQAATSTDEKADDDSKAVALNKSLAEILKNPNAAQRTKELEDFVRHLAPSDIGAALKQLRKMPEGSSRRRTTSLITSPPMSFSNSPRATCKGRSRARRA